MIESTLKSAHTEPPNATENINTALWKLVQAYAGLHSSEPGPVSVVSHLPSSPVTERMTAKHTTENIYGRHVQTCVVTVSKKNVTNLISSTMQHAWLAGGISTHKFHETCQRIYTLVAFRRS